MTTDEKLKEILERDYYVPDVSELCIGFEYSYKTDVIEHRVIESKYDLEFTFGLHLDNNLFVKKLDGDDIESFGLKVHSDYGAGTEYRMGDAYRLDTVKHAGLTYSINEVRIFKLGIFDSVDRLFMGDIKNKSELRRLLKQLNILHEK